MKHKFFITSANNVKKQTFTSVFHIFFLDKANDVEVFNCCHLQHCISRYIFSQCEVRYYTGICVCTTFTAITLSNTAVNIIDSYFFVQVKNRMGQ